MGASRPLFSSLERVSRASRVDGAYATSHGIGPHDGNILLALHGRRRFALTPLVGVIDHHCGRKLQRTPAADARTRPDPCASRRAASRRARCSAYEMREVQVRHAACEVCGAADAQCLCADGVIHPDVFEVDMNSKTGLSARTSFGKSRAGGTGPLLSPFLAASTGGRTLAVCVSMLIIQAPSAVIDTSPETAPSQARRC
jgi:hypothetical protein